MVLLSLFVSYILGLVNGPVELLCMADGVGRRIDERVALLDRQILIVVERKVIPAVAQALRVLIAHTRFKFHVLSGCERV